MDNEFLVDFDFSSLEIFIATSSAGSKNSTSLKYFFKNGKRNGKGVQIWKSHYKWKEYNGYWQGDVFQGNGKLILINGFERREKFLEVKIYKKYLKCFRLLLGKSIEPSEKKFIQDNLLEPKGTFTAP